MGPMSLPHSYPKSLMQLSNRLLNGNLAPLDAIYPIVYLDCIVVKIRQEQESDQQSDLPRSGR